MRTSLLTLVMAIVAATAIDAAAKDFVVDASKWGQKQQQAVEAAGGTVVFAHADAGLGVVTSEVPEFAERLRASGAFLSVDEDVVVKWQPPVREVAFEAAVTPGDETFIAAQWAPAAIHAPEAWNMGYTGKGVRVAILDGGIHSAHIDLVANLDVGASRSFVPGTTFNQDVGTFWHGTHVAGIVAAADNSLGTIGIAPEATLIGVKVLHDGSGGFGGVIAGILYAATPEAEGGAGADIINMSLGAYFPKNATGGGPLVAALNKAVNYANRYGVLVVTSAGNEAADVDHTWNYVWVPAQSGSAIAVSATGPLGFGLGATNFTRPASYTNYGNSLVHVAAPGGDYMLPGNDICVLPRQPSGSIVQDCWALDMVMSTVRGTSNGSYSWAAGTSMAAPAVSGVAALIKQRHPGISLGALKAKIAQSADDEGKKGNDPYYGKGFVNAGKAVQ